MKKIIATVLAMVMALALCTTAFAAGVTEGFIKATDAASKDVTPESVQLNYVKNTDPKTTDGKTGAVSVDVDGEKKLVNGNFPGGWGSHASNAEIYSSEETRKHTVTVTVRDGERKKFEILGWLVS